MKIQVYFQNATATLDNANALVIDGRYELIMDKDTHELKIRECVKTKMAHDKRKSFTEWIPRELDKCDKCEEGKDFIRKLHGLSG